MAHPLTEKITQQLTQQEASGLLRQRKLLGSGTDTHPVNVDFSHNDYLGLASSTELAQALYQGALTYGVGSKASPLVSGYGEAHQLLEQKLCAITGHQACMLFCSGFSANSALMKTLFDSTDVVIADKLVHASIIDGLVDSGAKLVRYLHNDIDSAARLLAKHPNNVLITESVFSMDGDIAPLIDIAEVTKRLGAYLIVDEAHSSGVFGENGKGLVNELNLKESVFARLVTFGKAYGSHGGLILGSKELIEFIVNFSRSFIYTTALPPSSYIRAGLIVAYPDINERRKKLEDNISYFRSFFKPLELFSDAKSPIQILQLGEMQKIKQSSETLLKNKIAVKPIYSPTVPVGQERLRICIHSFNSQNDIEQLCKLI